LSVRKLKSFVASRVLVGYGLDFSALFHIRLSLS
jgi:hypothetical protein